MNEITIKALSPDLEKDYFDFFDNRAFSDGSPYYPCYCNAFNMSAGEIEAMRDQAKQYGGGIEGWKRSLRETAVRMVRQVLSIVCFEISPDYRGKGIAKQLLKQICSDAARNGYQWQNDHNA